MSRHDDRLLEIFERPAAAKEARERAHREHACNPDTCSFCADERAAATSPASTIDERAAHLGVG